MDYHFSKISPELSPLNSRWIMRLWIFYEEVKNNLSLLDAIEENYEKIKGSENNGSLLYEYTLLLLDDEEVMIRANQLSFETEGLEEE